MYGAIMGDIVGSPYEFDRGNKTKEFEFFNDKCTFTDDSVMTVAVAEALMKAKESGATDEETKRLCIESMKKWGKENPNRGYGARFYYWVLGDDTEPYNSYGNGSAMRVSSAGWLYDTLEETLKYAALTAEVTHNHPEGIKGAQATAAAIFLARTGKDKAYIKKYIEENFAYNLDRTLDEIRPDYYHIESCMRTVPEAIIAFLEGTDFEDCIRNAVSLGGDTDTLAAITGSIAEAYYGVPAEIVAKCKEILPKEMKDVLSCDFAV